MKKWDLRYMRLAKEISTWSKDPSTKIGAVIIGSKGQVLSQGYNGFPRNIFDHPYRWENREVKYQYVVHAEMNAIYNATFNGVSLENALLYIWGLPCCHECAKGIIQVGITKVFLCCDINDDRWKETGEMALKMFTEAGVEVQIVSFEEFYNKDDKTENI